MEKAFLVKYGEIGVKGKNRHIFEEALVRQIEHALKNVDGTFKVTRPQGRIFVEGDGFDEDEVITALQKVFGIVWICPCYMTEDNGFEALAEEVCAAMAQKLGDTPFTFKCESRRARKNYPLDSMELSREMGAKIVDAFPNAKVDVHHPQCLVEIEIREKINFHWEAYKGQGGMPVGTSGRAMLLLSGGIDSPVAGYMIAKRGVTLDATYFHAPPYTSERAKQKVVDLAKQVAKYSGPIRLHVVNFTDVQLAIYEKCPHDELTIIMRRYMMKIAEHFAKENGDLGLITGESIGQVASQTMESLYVTNSVCEMPVFRPLIGFDKSEIVEIARKIGTLEISEQPFEDCCTVFTPRHPATHPKMEKILEGESRLEEEELIQRALEGTEVIRV
jgi:thiamine biosynthesis protein ThiI